MTFWHGVAIGGASGFVLAWVALYAWRLALSIGCDWRTMVLRERR